MGTTATGLRYPEPVDPVSQGAAAIKNLADDLTAKYGAVLLKAGNSTVALASGVASIQVTYPAAFPGGGINGVALTASAITGSAPVICNLTSNTATYFVARLQQMPSGTYSGNVTLYWLAFHV